MAGARRRKRGGEESLEELSLDLARISAILARLVELEALRLDASDGEEVSAREIEELIAARHARSEAFGVDLVNPGWSLLLQLFRAHLEKRPVRISRLRADGRVPATTALRWLDQLCSIGLIEKRADPKRTRGIIVALTPLGAEAMRSHFVATKAGWIAG